jgi:hypothetical protein
MGYGLAPILVHFGLLSGGGADYPFAVVALLAWLPLTAWLLWNQARSQAAWMGAAGFAVSMFALLFIARVFHPSYLLWPLTGVAAAVLLARPSAPSSDAAAALGREHQVRALRDRGPEAGVYRWSGR